jgi:hypothetical protein
VHLRALLPANLRCGELPRRDTYSGPDALLLQSPFAGVSGRDALAPGGCPERQPGERRRGLALPQAKRARRPHPRFVQMRGPSRAKLRRATKGRSSRTPVRGSRPFPRKRSGQTRPPLVVRLDGQVRAAEPSSRRRFRRCPALVLTRQGRSRCGHLCRLSRTAGPCYPYLGFGGSHGGSLPRSVRRSNTLAARVVGTEDQRRQCYV